MTEPIKPATDAQVEGLRKGLDRHAPVFDTAEDFSVWASIGILIARIESDAAKLKALELERDTVQQYADQVGANLRAAEGTLAERDEQIARYEDLIVRFEHPVCLFGNRLQGEFVCWQCDAQAEKRAILARRKETRGAL